jgi:hypothetical protein
MTFGVVVVTSIICLLIVSVGVSVTTGGARTVSVLVM